jgi:hypothetical protein
MIVYNGIMDPSGDVFVSYCKLFDLTATVQDESRH